MSAAQHQATLSLILESLLSKKGFGKRTFCLGVCSHGIENLRRAAKVETQDRVAVAMTHSLGDVKGVLAKLVIRGPNQFSAELDCCKSVEPIEDKP